MEAAREELKSGLTNQPLVFCYPCSLAQLLLLLSSNISRGNSSA